MIWNYVCKQNVGGCVSLQFGKNSSISNVIQHTHGFSSFSTLSRKTGLKRAIKKIWACLATQGIQSDKENVKFSLQFIVQVWFVSMSMSILLAIKTIFNVLFTHVKIKSKELKLQLS